MSGRRKIGARETYFPPFVNERFDGPPYWACTFTALLNGANVGFLGNKPPTHDEVRKLGPVAGPGGPGPGGFTFNMNDADMGGGVMYTSAMTVATGEDMLPKEPGAINGGIMKRSSDTPAPVRTTALRAPRTVREGSRPRRTGQARRPRWSRPRAAPTLAGRSR